MTSIENDPILKIQESIDPREARLFLREHSIYTFDDPRSPESICAHILAFSKLIEQDK